MRFFCVYVVLIICFLFIYWAGVEPSPLLLMPPIGLLYLRIGRDLESG
jgi:hypothetical protein